MFTFQFLVAVLIAVYTDSASAFQPGSDYDTYPTTNLYNCTGNTPVSDVTVRNAIDTLPQIDPSSGNGWEQWSLFLHGSPQMILRWNKGDQSSSVASPSHFDILMNVNGSIIQKEVMGNLSYMNEQNVQQIAIGNNSLTWDSDALWFNASISIDGYQIQFDSFSATYDAFHPNVAFYNGLLDQSGALFGSVPVIRGHVGSFAAPAMEDTVLDGLSVMTHMFSENPLPSYVSHYTAGTIWGYSTEFYDSHVFYDIETNNGTVHQAAFLGRALPVPGSEGDWSSAWATYAITDDKLYTLNVSAATNTINASFSGCTNTNNIPYLFNVTGWTLFGTFTDDGGGVTKYYTIVNGTTSAPFGTTATNGTVAGFFEEYVAPDVC